MLEFDAADPFPLIEFDAARYGEAQAHATAVDAWLDLQTEKIEESLGWMDPHVMNREGLPQQLWLGLPVSALLTPYVELRWLLSHLRLAAGDAVVDCGAGYGRLAFVLERHYPQTRFIGYEYVRERVLETQRVFGARGLTRSEMHEADLSLEGFELPQAAVYFIYDFGSKQAVQRLLSNLQNRAQRGPLTVVGRGRLVRDLIEHEHPWLSQVIEPRHFAHFSIYSSHEPS